jgi:nitroreductase
MDAIEALKTRRSVRSFTEEPIPKDVIEDVIDCGRLAATARNTQPWEFVVVTDKTTRAQLAALAPNGPFIETAPVCIVVLCEDGAYYLEDGCAATQNTLVAAHARGLGACWVAGDKKPYVAQVQSLVGAPKGHRLVRMIAIGHPRAQGAPAKRPLTELIHWEKF